MSSAIRAMLNVVIRAVADSPESFYGVALFTLIVSVFSMGWLLMDKRTRAIAVVVVIVAIVVSNLAVEAML